MSQGTIRRAQLVAPFGVGAMSVLVDGTSVITAGLDHWYDIQDERNLYLEDYNEYDWRLQNRLGVTSFRLPPDFRRATRDDKRNANLKVPVLRFPRWHFCMYCKRLELSPLSKAESTICEDKQHSSRKVKPRMSQVPFIAICSGGHLDDFPFREWVHRTTMPTCNGVLRLKSLGGGGLEGQLLLCDGCNKTRTLLGITNSSRGNNGEERTTLSETLTSSNDQYLCRGSMPWLGAYEVGCGLPLQGALRGAGNVYFPKVESSIYLPSEEGVISMAMHDLMDHPAIRTTMQNMHDFGFATTEFDVETLRRQLIKNSSEKLLEPISDKELTAAYYEQFQPREETDAPPENAEILSSTEEWRYPEFLQIRETPTDNYLTCTDPGISTSLKNYLERVRAVNVLRETRVLRGFTRVRDGILSLSEGKALLRRYQPHPDEDWLPAYVVKGEGIYFELDPLALSRWEAKDSVQIRARKIIENSDTGNPRKGIEEEKVSPRLILLHTLSHLLINELVFTAGYSSASLRERLYASTDREHEMAGVLIYTAAGDSEGTMGGLVRMSDPEYLSSVFSSAVSKSKWCSTDPVCMEIGEKGQGPDSCNLAACHSCALLPETSCEEFNRFLDRGLVIGTFEDPELGFFSQML